jgi:hypothetical protein
MKACDPLGTITIQANPGTNKINIAWIRNLKACDPLGAITIQANPGTNKINIARIRNLIARWSSPWSFPEF